MKEIGKKTHFTFTAHEYRLVEVFEVNPAIVMYWERKREVCPHCKEEIVKGEHHSFKEIEFWIPSSKQPNECSLSDLVIIGISDTATLMLTKDKIKEALEQSSVFKNLLEG